MSIDDFSVSQESDGIVQRPADGGGVSLGISDDGVDPLHLRGDVGHGAEVVVDESGLEQEILGG